jgi:eukaryotic-like serine/threonine-protein kinase
MTSDAGPSGVNPVDELAEEYLRRRRRGEHPTASEYVARHPALAEEILELFPALELIEGLKPTPDDHAEMSGDGGEVCDGQGARASRLGDYTLLRELGRGGMGIVYEAEHESLKSRMALKVMHPRFRADGAYVRRFESEARSAAKLHHTNIVPVFDYGEQDGVCYYAMQLIIGVGLEQVLEDVRRLRSAASTDIGTETGSAAQATIIDARTNPLEAVSRGLMTGRFAAAPTASLVSGSSSSAVGEMDSAAAPRGGESQSASSSFAGQPESVYFREAARLGAQVADALDYAHRQGVVHRDIKPSNLLLDARGIVWVTDFGLAKVLEGDNLSHSQDMVGTLRFMPPERFQGITNPLGDVYSLGATLYELLTLKPAFAERDQTRLIDEITHEAPVPLRQHDRRIPRDLETLVLKALARDPKDRFASAAELGDELHRYLESRPIRSRPVGPAERLWRWCKRSPGMAASSIGAALLATILVIGSSFAAWTFRNQDRKTRENLFDSLTAQAQARRLSRRVGRRFESLNALARAGALARELKLPQESFDLLRDETIACLVLPDLNKTGRIISRPPDVILSAFDSTMTRYALRFRDGTIKVRRVDNDVEVARFKARGDREIFVFGFSPDGRYLATTHFPGFALTVWYVDNDSVALSEQGPVSWGAANFSPDSRRLALTRHDGNLLVYNLSDSRQISRWHMPYSGQPAFRPDGVRMAILFNEPGNPSCKIVEVESGRVVVPITLPSIPVTVAWSPDGTALATACEDFKIHLWDAATGTRRATFDGHTSAGLHVAFHPAGTLLASKGWDKQLRLWDAVLARPVLSLTEDFRPTSLEFSQDGRILNSVEDQLITYQVEPALEYQTLAHAFGSPCSYFRPSIRNDGRVLAVCSAQGVMLWDLARGVELSFLPIGRTLRAFFEASGDLLTLTWSSLGVQRWPVQLDPIRGEFRIGPPRRLPLPVESVGLSAGGSGRVVATANFWETHVLAPDRAFTVGPLDNCRYVAVSSDGKWLATGSHHSSGAQVWQISDGTPVANLKVEGIVGVAFSSDGKWLMTSPSPCKLWAVGTWKEARRISGEGHCFSPDGRLLLVQETNKALLLVEAETGRKVARLESPDLCPLEQEFAAFSPDGSQLVVVTNDGPAIHVWDLRAIRKHLAGMGLDWVAPPYPEADPALNAPLPPLVVLPPGADPTLILEQQRSR